MSPEAVLTTTPLPDEERLAAQDERAWLDLLARISRQSVTKRFQAYVMREHRIPKSALREAYRGNRVYARARSEALGKTRALCTELGLVSWPYALIWSRFGILRS